jgi:hypothetical protein
MFFSSDFSSLLKEEKKLWQIRKRKPSSAKERSSEKAARAEEDRRRDRLRRSGKLERLQVELLAPDDKSERGSVL